MNSQNLDVFKHNLNTLIQTPIEIITRTRELGTHLDFSSITEHIESAKKIASKALLIDFSLLNDEKLNQFNQTFNQVLAVLKQIMEFKVEDPNNQNDPIQRRNRLIDIFKSNIIAFSDTILPFLSLVTYDVEAVLNSQKMEADKLLALIREQNILANKQLEAQSKVVSNTGINAHSNIFKDQSDAYRNNANIWLGFAIAILLAILCFGFYLLHDKAPVNQIEIIYSSVARIIILTSLFYALNICNKNVKSFRHNSILNKHRHNALMSFQTFTTSTEDEMTKNSILLEATRTIYGIQNTGFGDSDNDPENPIKVIEILKNITKPSGN